MLYSPGKERISSIFNSPVQRDHRYAATGFAGLVIESKLGGVKSGDSHF